MSVSPVWREYNPTTGNLLGIVTTFDFGNVSVGEFGWVRVFDIYVPGVSEISNVKLSITSSAKIIVNDAPIDIGSDGSAGNGNFGIETSTDFLPKNTLTRFFAGASLPVTVGVRGTNISKYIYLNVKMALSAADASSVTYQVSFDNS
jgi:hypothetical protein